MTTSKLGFLLSLITKLLLFSTNTGPNAFALASGDDSAEAVISWLKSNGGFLHPNLKIRRADPNEAKSIYGLVADGYISSNELLMEIPRSLIITSGRPPDYIPLECDIVRVLAKELRLGQKSKYAPYVNYLLDTQPPGRIPSAWSNAGKELFLEILGYYSHEALPPIDPIHWLSNDWKRDCRGTDDTIDNLAALLVVQLEWENMVIPVFDMISHRNGHWTNTIAKNIAGCTDNKPVQVYASRGINAGEQIYGSQNLCFDCEGRWTNYGTPDLLRDYGFLEKFPQRWIFEEIDVGFELDEVYKNGKRTNKYEVTRWIETEPSNDDIATLRGRIDVLKEDIEIHLSKRDPEVPEHEWKLINDFANAMVFAVSFLIDNFGNVGCAEGDCHINSGYRNLDKHVDLFIDESYSPLTCDYEAMMDSLMYAPYEELETIKSHYQEFTFFWNIETRATCFDIEGTVQICDDYRPHYHEMSVHLSARYLTNIKRVLFVGGGDSMLLYDILKYPSLEFVVGLEIDQKIVRYSFKHFGTQPYFENEKVQWWFGDASKSLRMLPKDYFGSFDLVLVDLSETITSNPVTEKLDIIGALSLLLKPDGIIVKNEIYLKPFASMFKYSVMVHWYDNPIICSQALSMASNNVDFINPTLKDHDVETLYLAPLKDIDDPFELYHDYVKNTTSHPTCHESDSNEAITQVSSPGILVILEAENTTVDLDNVDALRDILIGTLEKEGLTVVSAFETKSLGTRAFVSFFLREGYIVARTEPEHNYCGFDIHFWSSFHRQEGVKKALISAVKGESKVSSSFRIIAGGMFGVPTWKDDEKRRGPRSSETCDASKDTTAYKSKQSTVNNVFGEMTKLIDGHALKVAVLCGGNTATCESNSNSLKEKSNIDRVINLSCPMMQDFNEFGKHAEDTLLSCKDHLAEAITDSIKDGIFNVLIIDSTADKFIASVFLKLFKSKKDFGNNIFNVFEEEKTIILSSITDETEEWRMNFLKQFKEDAFLYDPVVYVEVAIGGFAEENFTILLVCENYEIVNDIKTMMMFLERKSGLKSNVRLINGGRVLMQSHFKASHSYSPDDYDKKSPLEQWESQQPIGLQVISQMESNIEGSLSKDSILASLNRSLNKLCPTEGETVMNVFDSPGDGCLLAATCPGGSVFVLWDGRAHVDVNMFAYEGLEHNVKDFQKSFQEGTSLSMALYDEHPRGFGRVVTYKHDFAPGVKPHWA